MRGGAEQSKVHAHAIKPTVVNLSCREVGTNVATKRDTSHDCCRCRSSGRSSLHGSILGQRIAHTPLGAVTEVYNWVKVHNTESGETQRLLVVG
jgi:hypothetical protein